MSLREVGGHGQTPESVRGDFNFESSNERLAAIMDKMSLSREGGGGSGGAGEERDGDSSGSAAAKPAYNKSSSFFDSLSSGQTGIDRSRERQLNMETFGTVLLVGTHQSYRGRGGRGGRGGGGRGRGGQGGYHGSGGGGGGGDGGS